MRYVYIAIFWICLGLLLLPLRSFNETSYTTTPQTIAGCAVRVEFDPTLAPRRVPYWFPGIEGKSPYRVRVTLSAASLQPKTFSIESITLRNAAGQTVMKFPPQSVDAVQTGRSGQPGLTIGYTDVELDEDQLVMELVFKVDGTTRAGRFELKKFSKHRIFHSGWESIDGG